MVRRLLLGYIPITFVMLLVLEIPFGFVIYQLERQTLISKVQHDAATIALYAEQNLEENDDAGLGKIVDDYYRQTKGRAVIVDIQGNARADSTPLDPKSPTTAENFTSRPEVAKALKGFEARGFRHSNTLHTTLLFVATPVVTGGINRGVVRITYPASFYERQIYKSWAELVIVGVLVMAVVTALSIHHARVVTSPLRKLEDASKRLGEGDLSARSPVPDTPPELVVLTTAFNDTASKLERLVDSQRAFVADASHQLRTPLAALRLRLEILEDAVPKRGREDFEAAVAEVHRLSRLVDGLLALARADNMPAAPEQIDVSTVISGRRANWEPLAGEHRVDLVEQAAEGLFALVTPGNLEQILDNLIANAIDISPPETTITVEGRRTAEWVEVHVIDEGPGMSAERRAGAFTRFWKAPDTQKRVGGFGIGLAIVRQLAEVDGGEVELLEAPSGGLDAAVRLRPAAGPLVPTNGLAPTRRRRPSAVRVPDVPDGTDGSD